MFSETLCRGWNFIGVRFWSIGYKKRILMLTFLIGITLVCLFVRTFLMANLTDLQIQAEQDNDGNINRTNVWDEWVREKGLKSIANIWDNCDQMTEREIVGKIVLHFDSKEKLVIATAVANFTAKASLTSGVVHVVAKFHGRTLYDVKHKLCKLKTETLKCPMLKGQVMNVYEPFKLPQYIPKGNYQSTAKLLNEDDVCLAMAESHLKI